MVKRYLIKKGNDLSEYEIVNALLTNSFNSIDIVERNESKSDPFIRLRLKEGTFVLFKGEKKEAGIYIDSGQDENIIISKIKNKLKSSGLNLEKII